MAWVVQGNGWNLSLKLNVLGCKNCVVCVETVNCCNNKTINDMLVIIFGALINWVEGKKVASFQDGHGEEYN
jgi:hypothetical protein